METNVSVMIEMKNTKGTKHSQKDNQHFAQKNVQEILNRIVVAHIFFMSFPQVSDFICYKQTLLCLLVITVAKDYKLYVY